jgi:hypothetical protein
MPTVEYIELCSGCNLGIELGDLPLLETIGVMSSFD